MTNGLAQALNGNFASLTRVGFVLDENTKKQIANGTEAERANALVKVLNSTYKDFNKNLRATDAGQMQVLSNSAQAATAIIGTGLLDALKGLGEDSSVDNLAQKMQDTAVYTADVIRGIGVLIEKLKGLGGLDWGYALEMGNKFSILGLLNKLAPESTATSSGTSAQGLADLARLQAEYAARTLKTKTKLTAEELKALKAARLRLAIEKANLALGLGDELFDIENIQVAAALTSQAEQLGKATSSAQVLAIANDVARLNVKESISDLEDAIASKDEAAITAATKKLNKELELFSALSKQELKLKDIKSVLDGLTTKKLIDIDNIDEAIKKLEALGKTFANPFSAITDGATAAANALSGLSGTFNTTSAALTAGLQGRTAGPTSEELATILGPIPSVPNVPIGVNPFQPDLGFLSGISGAAQGAAVYAAGQAAAGTQTLTATATTAATAGQAAGSTTVNNITVEAGIGDPNAIAEAIAEVLQSAAARGTLVGGLLPV
jgi:hypothetical protein